MDETFALNNMQSAADHGPSVEPKGVKKYTINQRFDRTVLNSTSNKKIPFKGSINILEQCS